MTAVLGIDAAWTPHNPSGVALVARSDAGWRLVALEASYQRFLALADPSTVPDARLTGSLPDPAALLAACRVLLDGGSVSVVAVDMPVSDGPIVGRRVSDNLVSSAWGARGCGTHTGNETRPGPISDRLRLGFQAAGIPLRTTTWAVPSLIEAYPHPALVELTASSYRVPYKAANVRKYWPLLPPAERRANLLRQWRRIVECMDKQIEGVAAAFPELPATARGVDLKAVEDKLDAVTCAWIGITALEGNACAYGDDHSAIWIPKPLAAARLAPEP